MVYQDLDTTNPSPVDLRLSIMKPLGARWLIAAYNYLKSKKEILANGFKAAGITDALKSL